jgi:hypothetical protein
MLQPPTWRTRSPYLHPLETGWPSYTPRHRVPILVASYETHGLRWDYSYSPVTIRGSDTVQMGIKILQGYGLDDRGFQSR